jgi:hypothetical protein
MDRLLDNGTGNNNNAVDMYSENLELATTFADLNGN